LDRVFLDANVLFSAAYGSPRILVLWDLAASGRCTLLASRHVIEEARRNLRPDQQAALEGLVAVLSVIRDPIPDLPCPIDLPTGDREAFLSAVGAGATHFLTGDTRHFGAYYGVSFGGVLVQTPAEYLAAQTG